MPVAANAIGSLISWQLIARELKLESSDWPSISRRQNQQRDQRQPVAKVLAPENRSGVFFRKPKKSRKRLPPVVLRGRGATTRRAQPIEESSGIRALMMTGSYGYSEANQQREPH
jgi:hypothetical protein